MGETRIQLCGDLVARVDGERVERLLPGRQGRMLFAFLAHGRRVAVTRAQLSAMLWDGEPPDAADSALSALLSKLRRVVPVDGRRSVRLVLPTDVWVDVEVAREALHRAESAVARGDWTAAWGPARVAQHVLDRPFLAGASGAWVENRRRELGVSFLRALELAGLAALRIGGSEIATAERSARRIVALAPLHESGTRLLMDVLAAQGNRAEALLAYDDLRVRLRGELGIAPSDELQALHRGLLGG